MLARADGDYDGIRHSAEWTASTGRRHQAGLGPVGTMTDSVIVGRWPVGWGGRVASTRGRGTMTESVIARRPAGGAGARPGGARGGVTTGRPTSRPTAAGRGVGRARGDPWP